jgi:hypothetical protein
MDNVISEYQKWKKQGEQLRLQAKQAMEARFHELLGEAVQIAQEYHRDFGAAMKPPASITAFRYKKPADRKARKSASPKPPAPEPPPSVNPKVVALHKQRTQLQKKLEVAKAAGKPTKNLDDRIYEVEDELRLAGENL